MNLTGNPAVLRRVNRVRILNKIFLNKPQSRAQLARETGLDPKTMTNLCAELQNENLISSEHAPAAGRGRPGELLQLNPDSAFSIGIDIGPYHVTAVLIDFQGNIRNEWERDFGRVVDAAMLLDSTQLAINSLLATLGKNSILLKGICLSVPGLISHKTGLVIQTVNIPEISGLNLIDHFSHFNIPIFLEGSSQAQAIAEKWFGGYYNINNFITMDIGYGIGMGIMFNGSLFRGANEQSGEIGHTVVLPNGPLCTCGKKGCLETVSSGFALDKMATSLPLAHYNIKSHGAKAIHEAAQQGNDRAIEILYKAGAYIGIAIANAITLFDPETVILNGGLVRAEDFILDSMKTTIQQNLMTSISSTVKIKTSSLGKLAGARGAAMVPLQHFFEFDKIKL